MPEFGFNRQIDIIISKPFSMLNFINNKFVTNLLILFWHTSYRVYVLFGVLFMLEIRQECNPFSSICSIYALRKIISKTYFP